MGRFFHYYTMEHAYDNAIQIFSLQHFVWLAVTIAGFSYLFWYLKDKSEAQINRAEKFLISTLLIGDWAYYFWNIFNSPNSPLEEILPLHLCSFGMYMTVLAFFTDNEKLRRMIAVTNTFGAALGLLYPATVASMFPTISYRVVYFFYEHGLLAFLGILQIKRFGGLRYRDIKFNMIPLTILAIAAFTVNRLVHADYLFIGAPPTLGLVRMVHDTVGAYLLLPMAVLGLLGINLLVTSVVKLIYMRRAVNCVKKRV